MDLLQLFKFFSILQQPGHHRKHTGSSDNEQKSHPPEDGNFRRTICETHFYVW